jgi:hypothetical protein
MELQGPEKFQDAFAKEILRFNRGGIVSLHSCLFSDAELFVSQKMHQGPPTADSIENGINSCRRL